MLPIFNFTTLLTIVVKKEPVVPYDCAVVPYDSTGMN